MQLVWQPISCIDLGYYCFLTQPLWWWLLLIKFCLLEQLFVETAFGGGPSQHSLAHAEDMPHVPPAAPLVWKHPREQGTEMVHHNTEWSLGDHFLQWEILFSHSEWNSLLYFQLLWLKKQLGYVPFNCWFDTPDTETWEQINVVLYNSAEKFCCFVCLIIFSLERCLLQLLYQLFLLGRQSSCLPSAKEHFWMVWISVRMLVYNFWYMKGRFNAIFPLELVQVMYFKSEM